MAHSAQSLILASTSPQRLALLQSHGFNPKVRQPNVDETPFPQENADALVERLALAKLTDVVNNHETGLAADTVVAINNEVFGKPLLPARATEMLKLLSGQTHQVFGGLVVSHRGRKVSRVIRTSITFRKVSEDEISTYVKTGEPLDKAGGYAIQGGAAHFVKSIDGCRENVVGLSIPAVLSALNALGIYFSD